MIMMITKQENEKKAVRVTSVYHAVLAATTLDKRYKVRSAGTRSLLIHSNSQSNSALPTTCCSMMLNPVHLIPLSPLLNIVTCLVPRAISRLFSGDERPGAVAIRRDTVFQPVTKQQFVDLLSRSQ